MFESQLKVKNLESKVKNQYFLTDLQKNYIQLYLPWKVSLRSIDEQIQKIKPKSEINENQGIQQTTSTNMKNVEENFEALKKKQKKRGFREDKKISVNGKEKKKNYQKKKKFDESSSEEEFTIGKVQKRRKIKKLSTIHCQEQIEKQKIFYQQDDIKQKESSFPEDQILSIDQFFAKFDHHEDAGNANLFMDHLIGEENQINQYFCAQPCQQQKQKELQKQQKENQTFEKEKNKLGKSVQMENQKNDQNLHGKQKQTRKVKQNNGWWVQNCNSLQKYSSSISQNNVKSAKLDAPQDFNKNSDYFESFLMNQLKLSPQNKKFCLKFLNKLKSYKASWPFRLPVNPIQQNVPNYLEVIHQPMDFKTIQKKINSNKYSHTSEFHKDINLIFLNSYKFNYPQSKYFQLTIDLENHYYQLKNKFQQNPNYFMKQKEEDQNQDFVEEDFKSNKKSNNPKSTTFSKRSLKSNKNFEEYSSQSQKISHYNSQQQMLKKSYDFQKYNHKRTKRIKKEEQKSEKSPSISFIKDKKFSLQKKKELSRKIKQLPMHCMKKILLIIYGEEEMSKFDPQINFQIKLDLLSSQTLFRLDEYTNKNEHFKDESMMDREGYFFDQKPFYTSD